jgi:CheY-like chemotaxis protein
MDPDNRFGRLALVRVVDQPVYSIGALVRMLGVPAATLRSWEDRYGMVIPNRSAGGHRLYSREDVEQLRFVRDELQAGMSPGDSHRLLQERLKAGEALKRSGTHGRVGLLILLAERDPFAADFAEYFLRTEGYVVDVVMNFDGAMAQMVKKPPDVAVIDMLISGGRGLQLCKQLRQQFDVPILAISTLAQRDAALEAGASAFLKKPLEPLQLVSAIKDLLGQSAFLRAEVAE